MIRPRDTRSRQLGLGDGGGFGRLVEPGLGVACGEGPGGPVGVDGAVLVAGLRRPRRGTRTGGGVPRCVRLGDGRVEGIGDALAVA
jgi:hypothetical protein